ncbi:MAG TPA: replicative DNA helicase [Solirubrobacterales bacterium]|nr:replicative DNA helicase [Solirubrobacterales bacterium]
MPQPSATHVPPQNIEAEESVLGAMLVAEPALSRVIDEVKLNAEDFYLEKHAAIFRAVHDLYAGSKPVDELSVSEALTQRNEIDAAGGKHYVSELAAKVPAAGNAKHYAEIVQQNSLLRRLLGAGQEIQGWVHERDGEPRELSERAEKLLFDVAHKEQASDFRLLSEILHDEVDRLEKLSTGELELTGTPSGFRDIDSITGGFQPGNLIIVAARPAMGKSAIVANIAENVAVKRGMPVAFFSLEMSEVELAQRFIACRARISGDKLRKGQVAQKDWPKVVRACNELEEAPLWFDDSSDLGLLDLRAKARRLHAQTQDQGGLGLVIVDYLQLMRADDMRANRVEQVGQMSRGLKILARELEVPVLAISQLSRAPEQRSPAKPMLSDLRESGCLTGDSLVHLPGEGARRPIRELAGQTNFEVLAMDPETWQLRPAMATRAFSTGHKQAFRLTTRLGRTIRATGNHRFLTIAGWRRLDELATGDPIAVPGTLPDTPRASLTENELALLGHLIGDGCTLPRHVIQYTSNERKLAGLVADLTLRVFGKSIRPRLNRERSWYQVYLSATERLTHGKRNPVAAWLDELGVFGLRSYEKRVPNAVFAQPSWAIATFLRHLWATDGSVWLGGPRQAVRVYYSTSSSRLAHDVQTLLLRLEINARVSRHESQGKGRPQFHVTVGGGTEIVRFLETVGALGANKRRNASAILEHFDGRARNPNRDLIPKEAWRSIVVPSMEKSGMTSREMQGAIDTRYCGSALYRTGIGKERAMRVASAVRCEELVDLALGDAYWDPIVSIEPDGVEEVFDITVERLHNFVADNVVVHNSIEQDADLVAFLYREDYYRDPEDEPDGLADVIIAKHRNGPIGAPKLVFLDRFPKFADHSGHERPVEQPAGEGPPLEDAASAGPDF